jgi:hypothetical protein
MILVNIKWVILLCLISVGLLSRSSENDCFIADQVELIRVIQIDERDYYVYLKISGWHDKSTFYELYDREPTFNQCGVTGTLPISVMDLNPDLDPEKEKVSGLIINSSRKEMTVVYSKDYSQDEYQQGLRNVSIETVEN